MSSINLRVILIGWLASRRDDPKGCAMVGLRYKQAIVFKGPSLRTDWRRTIYVGYFGYEKALHRFDLDFDSVLARHSDRLLHLNGREVIGPSSSPPTVSPMMKTSAATRCAAIVLTEKDGEGHVIEVYKPLVGKTGSSGSSIFAMSCSLASLS